MLNKLCVETVRLLGEIGDSPCRDGNEQHVFGKSGYIR
jgi:hypothetical protein